MPQIKEYTNRELGILIETGFKGVWARQDTTNGNVREHTQCIQDLNKSVADINKWRWMITGGLILSNVIIIPILLMLITKII